MNGEPYTVERLAELLRTLKIENSSKEIVEDVFKELKEFSRGTSSTMI